MSLNVGQIYTTILDLILSAISIYLALILRNTYMRTKSKEILAFSWALFIFAALGFIAAITHLFTDVPVDELGGHQWIGIIFVTMLIFIFRPRWHQVKKAQETKGGKAA